MGGGKCFKDVDFVLECYPQLVAIDEEADHQIVHGRVVVPVREYPEEEETALLR